MRRWERPWRKRRSHCWLHAAEHTSTYRSGKDKPSGIDRYCPNIATCREQSIAHISPKLAVVYRSKHSTGSGYEDVAERVDCHAVHVKCREVIILFRPGGTVISGTKYSAAFAHDRMCSGENVTVTGVNGERSNVR
jgi:hypothetical protein